MSIIDLERRLARIEAGRRTGAPTTTLSDRPVGDPAGTLEVTGALTNWQRWLAQGKATVSNGVLCLTSPEMTAEEWAERYVTGD
jgi:hypothetical protein